MRCRRLRKVISPAAAAFLLSGVASACQEPPALPAEPTVGVADPSEPPADPCADAGRFGDACHAVVVDGRAYRYALIEGDPGSGTATLVDVGGPGISLFGSGWPQELLSEHETRNVVILEEPWVTADQPDGCPKALTDWYLGLRDRWPLDATDTEEVRALGAATADVCELFTGRWGWAPELYQQVVAAVEREHGLGVDHYVGVSFGSRRAHYLGTSRDLEMELVSPFPYGVEAAAYLRSRQELLPAAPAVAPGPIAGRSLAVDDFDIAAARVEAQYLTGDGWRALSTGPDAAGHVGRLADMLFGRYGEDSISPAILAYWDETCPSLSDWHEVRREDHSLLAAFTSPCHVQHPTATGSTEGAVRPRCVVRSTDDLVVPPALLDEWLRARGWPPAASGSGAHADTRLLERCR